MVSVSTGEARLEGARLVYELRMPLYEAQHLERREALLDLIRFDSARRIEARCVELVKEGVYLCTGTYEFPQPVERFIVESSLHTATVPNHVHVLRATLGGKTAQAVLDVANSKAEVRFVPPGMLEIAVTRVASGMARVFAPASLLFLAALALAARSRRELAALIASFSAGQIASVAAAPLLPFEPKPAFLESASALATAYLAVEMIFLPKAGQRWLVVAMLGLAQGFGLAAYRGETVPATAWLLAGALAASALAAALLHVPLRKIQHHRAAPIALLLAAAFWLF